MSSPYVASGRPSPYSRAIPLTWILLIALAIHGPLLVMQLPNASYDANLHKFFAAHYAQHWFNPWNEKWFAGFSQTTYPPLEHQWIALFSHLIGLDLSYMLVQFIGILLLPVGMYRYARIWVGERAASYAALGSVLIGALSFLVYQSGQITTTVATAILLNALPYFYDWLREARFTAFLKGLALTLTAGAAHHVTLLFASIPFALPVFALAIMDRKREGTDATSAGVISRAIIFTVLAIGGFLIVLAPYWIALYHNPIKQMPIPHASRDNFIQVISSGMNFFIIPWGALLLALPYIFVKGLKESRLRPLFLGFWLTTMFALGGTTPLPKLLLGRAYDVLTFERFSFWANLMALPIVGLLVIELVERYGRKAAIAVGVLAGLTTSIAVAWPVYHPIREKDFSVDQVIAFLNRDNHDKFRYLTLGFGNEMSLVGTYANAGSVDGEYNSARLLPEMTQYGSAQLTNSKFYGVNGMESLRQVLKHADQYGLKWIFVRDRYYEPLLAFAGWRKTEVYDRGNVTLWSKDGIPPAHPMDLGTKPTAMEGLLWGTLPIGTSILAIFLVLALPDKRGMRQTIEFPSITSKEPLLKEAR